MRKRLVSVFGPAVFVSAIGFHTAPAHTEPVPNVWTQIGRGLQGTIDGPHNASGRAIQVAWRRDRHQANQNILWVGTQYGGLWKSIVNSDGDVTSWIPLTDNFPGPHGMGSFLVNRVDSNKILVGPGGFISFNGDGNVYRTHNQGMSWNAHHLPKPSPQRVTRLVDDRSNPQGDIVMAATSTGIYRSEDFGVKWTLVFGGSNVTDIVQDTGDPSIWYAAALTPPHVILRSTNNGVNWLPMPLGEHRITGTVGRISLAACASDKNVLYALVVNDIITPDDKDGALNGVYRSLDRGANWTSIFSDNDAVNDANQGEHTCAIGCDPTNSSHIFFGLEKPLETFTATFPPEAILWTGLENHRSILDGGHSDYNYVLFRPGHQSIVIASDGGFYIYHPKEPLPGTVDDSGNLQGIEANFMEVKNGGMASSRTDPKIFVAGLADNGVILGDAVGNTLKKSLGGDGGQASIMPDDPNIIAASTNGDVGKFESLDMGASWFNINHGLEKQSFSSVLVDPTPGINIPSIFTSSLDLESGLSQIVFRSILDPVEADWQPVGGRSFEGTVNHLDHTTDEDIHEIIFTVSGKRRLSAFAGPRSELGHLELVDITPPLHALSNNTRDASANADKSGLQPDTIYYTTDTSRPSQALISTDSGQHWEDVTGDMPAGIDGPDFVKLIANPKNPLQLFLATSKGVFRSDTLGLHWSPYSEGLRLNDEIQDIVINVHGLDSPTLYVASRGRGFWSRAVEQRK